MKKATTFRKTLLIDIAIAAAIILPLLVGVVLLQSYIKHTAEQVVTDRHELTKRIASLNALVALRKEYETYGEKYLNVLHNVIPEKDELINISQEFQSLAARENLGFGFSFRGEEAPKNSTPGFVQFTITVNGENFDQLTNFIEKLKDFRYLTTIDRLNITRGDKGLQAVMQGKVHFR